MANSQYDLDLSGGLMPVSEIICHFYVIKQRFELMSFDCSKFKLCLRLRYWKIFRKKNEKTD